MKILIGQTFANLQWSSRWYKLLLVGWCKCQRSWKSCTTCNSLLTDCPPLPFSACNQLTAPPSQIDTFQTTPPPASNPTFMPIWNNLLKSDRVRPRSNFCPQNQVDLILELRSHNCETWLEFEFVVGDNRSPNWNSPYQWQHWSFLLVCIHALFPPLCYCYFVVVWFWGFSLRIALSCKGVTNLW